MMPPPKERKKGAMQTTIDVELYIEVFDRFGPLAKPALRLSKFLSNKEDIEELIKKSLDDEIIIAKVVFKNKNLAIPRLVRLGLVDPEKL
jgi:hypothetical protein